MTNQIEFALNGEQQATKCRPDTTVLEWLRAEALLRGTKEGCAEGDCGACSVLIKRTGDDRYIPANSCIMLMGQVEGANLLTVEGLAGLGEQGHPVQLEMAENGSSQCGYCTPGIVSALAGLLERNDDPAESDIHDALAGNLCRCTGYRPIVEAAFAAAKAGQVELPQKAVEEPKIKIGTENCQFHAPTTLHELLQLRVENPDAVLLAGGTDINLYVAHARARWPEVISTRQVEELRQVEETRSHLVIGGAVTWEQVLPVLEIHWPSFATLVRRFGSTQIRGMGTIAGNLGTGSPIGDGAPALLALGASLTLTSNDGERAIALDEFFLGYRKLAMEPHEVISKITIPLPKNDEQLRVYKVSKRYDQDISTVCGAFNMLIEEGEIKSAHVAFGGMAATPLRSPDAEAAFVGNALDQETVDAAKVAIRSTFQPLDDMRGTAAYRLSVAANLLDRFALDVAGETVEVMSL